MRKSLAIGILMAIVLVLASSPSMVFGAGMADYCQVPPFVSAVVPPNIMLLVDVSGSMSQSAYTEERVGFVRRYCSLNSLRTCRDDRDCQSWQQNWGICVDSASTTIPYGFCSNALTTPCELTSTCQALASCTSASQCSCVPRQVYEGYFNPGKDYYFNTGDSTYYEEANVTCGTKYTYLCNTTTGLGCSATKPADSLTTCSAGRFYCSRGATTYDYTCRTDSTNCTGATTTRPANAFNSCSSGQYYCTNYRTAVAISVTGGDCGTESSGNLLNYKNMRRIDLLRWAMTGGRPESCGSTGTTPQDCDPREWQSNSTRVGRACSDTQKINTTNTVQGGCILKSDNGTKIAVPWERVNDGLVFQLADLSIKPRMGAMFFEGSGVKSNRVYVGDFTSSTSTSNFVFQNLLSQVNSTNPGGATPTGPAMWDVYHYFSQTAPEYGGLPQQTGYSDKWKNPMYNCLNQNDTNCKFVPCGKNFVLLMSDGLWNRGGTPPLGFFSQACSIDIGFELNSADPVVPSYKMHMGFTNAMAEGTPTTKVSAVYAVGLFVSVTGQKALENIALYGSFDNSSKTWPSNRTNYPGKQAGDPSNCPITESGAGCTQGTGSNCNAVPASSTDWDKNGDGVADTFFYADDALAIRNNLLDAVLSMLSQAASGTGASVLASGGESGANLMQAIFHTSKTFKDVAENTAEIAWIGEIKNLWYYLDPQLAGTTIREDTVRDNVLNLNDDYVVKFFFDPLDRKTKVSKYDNFLNFKGTVDFDQTSSLWEAGKNLWNRSLTSSPRTIYTNAPGCSTLAGQNMTDFSSSASCTQMQSYLQASSQKEAQNIVDYIRGEDFAYCSNNLSKRCTSNADCPSTGICTMLRNRTVMIPSVDSTPRVWKLSDIITSTPKVQSWIKLNSYDSEPPQGYSDNTYSLFINSNSYKKRGMAYVGANDGMLHAFKFGLVEMINDSSTPGAVSRLCDDSNDNGKCDLGETSTTPNLGQEKWSFIPEGSLPYLKYLGDPNYCHLYYVDATPYLVDASIHAPSGCTAANYWDCLKADGVNLTTNELDLTKSSWRTILIGSMGLGGACRDLSSSCTDCVKTPVTGVGYSSYFALDVTNPDRPVLLWEFSDANLSAAERATGGLGFSTSGPAVVRLGDGIKNGRWFAVFASGPTGPIDLSSRQFQGKSDQRLKLFVIDLATGTFLKSFVMDGSGGTPNLPNSFGGALGYASIDTDRATPGASGNYEDEVFYVGYSQLDSGVWKGGVLRVTTKELVDDPALDPANWKVSTLVENIGPVTVSTAHLLNRKQHELWLYFGTGRYFYKTATAIDDADALQAIYGVKDPCFSKKAINKFDKTCTDKAGALDNRTTSPPSSEPANGWFINLDLSGPMYKAERSITAPLAAWNGNVFFVTFNPTSDVCGFGGHTQLWGLHYNTGGAPSGSTLQGKALIQVSTGSIEEIDLKTAFTEKEGRRTVSITGVPPKGQGLSVILNPRPVKKILQIQEK